MIKHCLIINKKFNEMKNRRWFCLVIMLFALIALQDASYAQAGRSSDYNLNPSWVQMMSDSNVNYFDAVKTYNDYWKDKKKPGDEEEEMEMMAEKNHSAKMTDKEKKKLDKEKREHEQEMERESKKKLTSEDMKKLEWKTEMTYQCKRFEDWMRSVKPFVQSDGHILTENERIKIYEQRQRELKQD